MDCHPPDQRSGIARLPIILLAAFLPLSFVCSANAEEPSLGAILTEDSENIGFTLISEDSPLMPIPGTPGSDGIPGDNGVEILDLDQLEQLTLTHTPSLQQADAEVMRLEGIWTQVGLKPNPLVGYQAAEVGNEGSAGQQGFFIGQEFVTGGKLRLNRAVAYQAIQQATWQRETQRQRVLNTMRRRYYETLGAKRTIELVLKLQGLAQSAVVTSEQLLASGEGTKRQVTQAKIEQSGSSIVLQNARSQRKKALRRLSAAVGLPVRQSIRIQGNLDTPPPNLDFDSVWQWLVENSPELQASYYAVNRARWSIQRAHVEPIPNIDAQLGVAHDFSTNDDIVNIQIGIPLPVRNRNQGNITAADADLIRASREVQRLELELRDRLATVFQIYENTRNQVKIYRTEILPMAEGNLKLVQEGYEGAELDYRDLLIAQRTFFRQSLSAVNAQTSLWLSIVSIQGLVVPEGLGAPGEIGSGADAPDANTSYPLGLFPMLLP